MNETVSGNHNGFQQITIPASGTSTVWQTSSSTGNSGIAYFYAESLSTNTGIIDIKMTNNDMGAQATYIARLIPGDVIYMPLWAANNYGVTVEAENGSGSSTAKLSFFVGEKD